MKCVVIDLEPYREKAVNEVRQARLDQRMARRSQVKEIGGYPWRNITADEAMSFIRGGMNDEE